MKSSYAALAVLSALSCAIQPAVADDAQWYVGLGAGKSQSKLDDERLANEVSAPGFAAGPLYWDHHGDAFKAFGGYKFSNYFGLEASYFDLGKFSFFGPTSPSGSVSGTLRVRGVAADAVGYLPITERLSAFAKVGVNTAQTRDEFAASAGNFVSNSSPREWRTNPKAGAGMQYDFARHFGLRGEWERYRVSDAVADHGNVDAWFVSLVFPFGRTTPPLAAQPVAVPVAEVAAPPPVVVAPPPPVQPIAPPPRRHVSFSADALFAFNSSALSADGVREVDKFSGELAGTRFERIHITGYTDRIGSDAYNLRLSQQRADAVKQRLLDSGGVAATKIDAEGRGKSDPVTKPGDCGGKRTLKTIACLQADRRVDIEVEGTQAP